jgi:predicted Zn-dependent peptidase
MHKFKVTKLNNGLRILTVPSKESLSFQAMVLVNTGANFETKENNGISHFLEHMCFKGTKKRPSSYDIVKELDSVGGSYNAFTGGEYTGYYATVSKQKKNIALDVVSDIYLNSQFPEYEIKKERGVIMEEINMYKDDSKIYIWDFWNKLLYNDQSIGRPVFGSRANIKRFKREDFIKYYDSQYRAKSTVVVISGNFSEKEIINEVKEYFGNIKLGQGKSKEKAKEKQKKPQLILKNKKTDQTHLVLGVRGIDLFDKRIYALKVLDAILGGGMSGILFQIIREKMGVAYYIHNILSCNSDHGFWAVSAGVDNSRLEEVVITILNEWKKFKIKPFSIKDIKKAQNYIIGKLSLSLEDVHNMANDIAFQELLRRRIETPKQYFEKIKQVSPYDLQKVAQDLLKTKYLNLALIGPHKNKRKLEKLLHV